MPPQQPDRLLDLSDDGFSFSAHGESGDVSIGKADVAIGKRRRNRREAVAGA
jgi:hypothetical protein